MTKTLKFVQDHDSLLDEQTYGCVMLALAHSQSRLASTALDDPSTYPTDACTLDGACEDDRARSQDALDHARNVGQDHACPSA